MKFAALFALVFKWLGPAITAKFGALAVAAAAYLALVAFAVFAPHVEARALLIGAAVAVAYGAGLATEAALGSPTEPPKS